MPRFFFDITELNENTIVIRGDDHKHLIGALRSHVGDMVTMCDGDGMDYTAQITEINDKHTVLSVLHASPSSSEPEIQSLCFKGFPRVNEWNLHSKKQRSLVCIAAFRFFVLDVLQNLTIISSDD